MDKWGGCFIRQPVLVIVGLCLIVHATGIDSRANEMNYQNYIIGSRASGMAGAVCAIARSIDACYFNPAGLSWVEYDSIAASASLYGYQHTWTEQDLDTQSSGQTESFLSIPTSVGSVKKFSDSFVGALAAFVPDRFSYQQSEVDWDRQHFASFGVDNQTLWLGPSLGYYLNRNLSLGAGLYVLYRNYSSNENTLLVDLNWSYTSALSYYSFDSVLLLGGQYRLGKHWSFGLMFQTPSFHLNGKGEIQLYHTFEDEGQYSTITLAAQELDARNNVPAKCVLGIAYEENLQWAVSLDLTYHGTAKYNRLKGSLESGEPASVRATHESVIDCNLGAEYFFSPKIPFRCGLFSSFSPIPDPDPDNLDNTRQIDIYGICCSLARELPSYSISFGCQYSYGIGESLIWTDDLNENITIGVGDSYEEHLYFMLSSTYYF